MDAFENTVYHEKMIGFLIKKAFFDMWDNMFRIVLLNLGFIASVAVPIFLPGIIPIPALAVAVFAAGILWCFVYLAAAALSVKAVSDYGAFGFADFGANLKAGWSAGLLMGLISLILLLMVQIVIPFYLDVKSPIGILPAAVIFWTFILSLVSFQFFFAIRARLDTKPSKIIKKCFIIFFDNPGFALFSFLYATVTLVLSVFLAFLLPGPAGILLFLDEGLRLRLLKYDWLEANPAEAGTAPRRRQIPWDAILIEEREKTGTRSFRNFIFPWKD
jgi:hypothetical protein